MICRTTAIASDDAKMGMTREELTVRATRSSRRRLFKDALAGLFGWWLFGRVDGTARRPRPARAPLKKTGVRAWVYTYDGRNRFVAVHEIRCDLKGSPYARWPVGEDGAARLATES